MKSDDFISETFEPITPDVGGASRYQGVELMGVSKTARVYRAVSAGKRVVIKTTSDGRAEHLDLLQREYAIWKELDHHHVAQVFTWDADTPVGAGIVMEYIDGESLAEYLESNPSHEQRLRLLGQLLDGVEYLHHIGITHNDLKTTNLLVSRRNGDLKIIDFGYADCDAEFLRRQLGGTEGYASPELRSRRADADARSDIYSIGVIMRKMFGRRYAAISARSCNPDPLKRYSNIEALRQALQRRRRMPLMVACTVAAVAVVAGIVAGVARISDMRTQISGYAADTATLTDSIGKLNSRLDTTLLGYAADAATLTDSIGQLNSRLDDINRQKAREDSLAEEYAKGADKIVARYVSKLKTIGYSEAFVPMCPDLRADIERFGESFSSHNGDLGRRIVDRLVDPTMARCATTLGNEANNLPSLKDLIDDPVEYSRVLPLVLKGEPYKAKEGK